MKRLTWPIVLGVVAALLVGVAIGITIRARRTSLTPIDPASPGAIHERSALTRGRAASILAGVVVRQDAQADLYLPASTERPGQYPLRWMLLAYERQWPAPDAQARSAVAMAVAMQQRGIAVALVSFSAKAPSAAKEPSACGSQRACAESVAAVARELSKIAAEHELGPRPVLVGEDMGAAVVSLLALDTRFSLGFGATPGVFAMNGRYGPPSDLPDDADAAPIKFVRADAPPFHVLSASGDSPASAQSSRLFTRALERAGSKSVRGFFVSSRDARSLANFAGEGNDVAEQLYKFVTGASWLGAPESTWSLADTWGPKAPLSSEPFWADERLVVRRPADAALRARIRNVFGEMMRDLDPWPAATYDAIDLDAYLGAHPELGKGEHLEITNARGEKLVLRRAEIARKKPVIVVGIDDERNLFRLFVTYNVHRTYSWKAETETRPLLVRNVGAFLYVPGDAGAGVDPSDAGAFHVTTMADFALTTASFHLTEQDPLAVTRKMPKPVAAVLTNEQGCLQCHALRGNGGRAHHLRAADGKLAEAFALPLEEYPREVLKRFLFEQDAVAKSFGVGPLHVSGPVATQLLGQVTN